MTRFLTDLINAALVSASVDEEQQDQQQQQPQQQPLSLSVTSPSHVLGSSTTVDSNRRHEFESSRPTPTTSTVQTMAANARNSANVITTSTASSNSKPSLRSSPTRVTTTTPTASNAPVPHAQKFHEPTKASSTPSTIVYSKYTVQPSIRRAQQFFIDLPPELHASDNKSPSAATRAPGIHETGIPNDALLICRLSIRSTSGGTKQFENDCIVADRAADGRDAAACVIDRSQSSVGVERRRWLVESATASRAQARFDAAAALGRQRHTTHALAAHRRRRRRVVVDLICRIVSIGRASTRRLTQPIVAAAKLAIACAFADVERCERQVAASGASDET
jgi:hypothetical protein